MGGVSRIPLRLCFAHRHHGKARSARHRSGLARGATTPRKRVLAKKSTSELQIQVQVTNSLAGGHSLGEQRTRDQAPAWAKGDSGCHGSGARSGLSWPGLPRRCRSPAARGARTAFACPACERCTACAAAGSGAACSGVAPRDNAHPAAQWIPNILKRPTPGLTDGESAREGKRQRTLPGTELPRSAQRQRVSAPTGGLGAGRHSDPGRAGGSGAGFVFRPPQGERENDQPAGHRAFRATEGRPPRPILLTGVPRQPCMC